MHREKVCEELESLCGVLESFYGDCVRDVGALRGAISRIRSACRNDEERPLKVDVQKLIFEIPEGHKHTLPKGVKDSVISLCISMHFKGHLATFDEIENLNIDFELHAMDAQGMPVKSAWHFDFHEVVGDEHFSHPRFHFQFGGKRLRESDRISNNDCDSGELLLMESPRIMHPPLDLTLAIDFLFGNFLGRRNWLRLRSDSIYRKIHGTSKSLYWRPFFDSISGYFDSPDSFKNATDLHPGL